MQFYVHDFNGAYHGIQSKFQQQWNELKNTLHNMPLYLKKSDQAKKKTQLIFDPVGTNQYIKDKLTQKYWNSSIPLPQNFKYFGKHIDFGKGNVFLEVQFSNYPFLLNNTVRSEVFYQAKEPINQHQVKIIVILTKVQKLPAANSTLYFEQAKQQLIEIEKYKIVDIPIRLLGLYELENQNIKAIFSEYKKASSREVNKREEINCQLNPGSKKNSSSTIQTYSFT